MFIERIGAEAETPILWPPDAKNWLIGKDPDAGQDWRQEEKRKTEDEMVGWHHQFEGHEFEQALGVVMDREAWHAAVHGVTKSWKGLSDWTELNKVSIAYKSPTLLLASFIHTVYLSQLLNKYWYIIINIGASQVALVVKNLLPI